MRSRPRSALWLLFTVALGACAQPEQQAVSANNALSNQFASSSARRGASTAEVLAYFQRIKSLAGDALAAEHQAAAHALAKQRSDVNRLKLALLLIQPRTAFRDDGRAAALADEVANNKTGDAPELKQLALLLGAVASEQKLQEERMQQLAQKQKDDEKRADVLQQKLDALKSIEKDLIQRQETKPLKAK